MVTEPGKRFLAEIPARFSQKHVKAVPDSPRRPALGAPARPPRLRGGPPSTCLSSPSPRSGSSNLPGHPEEVPHPPCSRRTPPSSGGGHRVRAASAGL